MSDTKLKNKIIFGGLLSTIILSGFQTTTIQAKEIKEDIPVENQEILRNILEDEILEKKDSDKTASDLTNIMGLTTYSLDKNTDITTNFEKIVSEIIKTDTLDDTKNTDINSLKIEKIGENQVEDRLGNTVHKDIYVLGDYLISAQNFDTNKVGKQKVTIKYRLLSSLEVKMVELFNSAEKTDLTELVKTLEEGDIISKNIIIDVKDVNAPIIHLSSSSEEIVEGESFNIANYIEGITDDTDTNLNYTVQGNYDTNSEGTYSLTIETKDNSGNASSAIFTLKVKKPAVNVVANARSLSGSPYVWGGTTPTGFDCSGFVQYVFRQNGVYLPRTAAAQGGAGYGVSASEIRAGDIVIYGGGAHVGIYIGNGQIIHALNPSVGIVTGQWDYPYNGGVTAIRRVI